MAVHSARALRAPRPSSHSSDWRLLLVPGMTTVAWGARSAAEAQSYFVTQLRRTIGIGIFRAEAQAAFAVRESSAAVHMGRRCAGGCATRRMRITGTRWPIWRLGLGSRSPGGVGVVCNLRTLDWLGANKCE